MLDMKTGGGYIVSTGLIAKYNLADYGCAAFMKAQPQVVKRVALLFFIAFRVSLILLICLLSFLSICEAAQETDIEWNERNVRSAFDPVNRRGSPPIGMRRFSLHDDRGAGNGNFQFMAPVLHLPGRGLDVTLNLSYNSRVWHVVEGNIIFDVDADWPAVGWTLGFGKLVKIPGGGMFLDADGTRRALVGQENTNASDGSRHFNGHTVDGSFIDFSYKTKPTPESYKFVIAQAKYPDGTVVDSTSTCPETL
jgi:hypothetical protein